MSPAQVSDWRFPYKRSHHPVCIHGGRVLTEFVLRDCDPGALPGTELYAFPQATSCKCHACKSSEASCEGYRYRDFQFGFAAAATDLGGRDFGDGVRDFGDGGDGDDGGDDDDDVGYNGGNN